MKTRVEERIVNYEDVNDKRREKKVTGQVIPLNYFLN